MNLFFDICVVYTKKSIHLSVGSQLGKYPPEIMRS